jgi:hypothetical protein
MLCWIHLQHAQSPMHFFEALAENIQAIGDISELIAGAVAHLLHFLLQVIH